MNGKKITIVFGTLAEPLSVGKSAMIRQNGQTIRTSTVVAISLVSPQQVSFETRNTNYVLMSSAAVQVNPIPAMSGYAA